MRDANIIQLSARNAHNVATLYRNLIQIDARMQAIEQMLTNRKQVFLAIFFPRAFWESVSKIQSVLLRNHDEQIKQAQERAKEEALKPKITVVR